MERFIEGAATLRRNIESNVGRAWRDWWVGGVFVCVSRIGKAQKKIGV